MFILGEPESLLAHFDEQTMVKQEISIWSIFDHLQNHCGQLFLLDGEIGKRRRVAAYMEPRLDNGFACEVVCEFDAEANVHVKAHFRRTIPYGDTVNDYDHAINRVLRACLNPLLDEARRFLQSTSGSSGSSNTSTRSSDR